MGMTTSVIWINPHIVSRASDTIYNIVVMLYIHSLHVLGTVAGRARPGAFDVDKSVT